MMKDNSNILRNLAADTSFLGLQHYENHKRYNDVLNYYKVVGPLYKKGGTSNIFVVRRRTQPRTRFGRWISHMKVDGSTVSLYSAALHAPQIPSGILDGSEFIHSDEPKQIYAIKSLRKDRRGSPCCLNSLKNEAQLLKQLDHPNIIRIFETFDRKKEMNLVLEFCSGGDLHRRAPYTEKNAAEIVKKILLAVHYLHKNHIVHRDLKFENILFENGHQDAEIKLVDFGMSRRISNDQGISYGKGGTPYVMSPEALQGYYSTKTDIWSVGVISFMLLFGKKPFGGESRDAVAKNIREFKLNEISNTWNAVTNEAKLFLSSLLSYDPMTRPSSCQALFSPWVVKSNKSSSSVGMQCDDKKIKGKVFVFEETASFSVPSAMESVDMEGFLAGSFSEELFDDIVKIKNKNSLRRVSILSSTSSTVEDADSDSHNDC